MKVGLLASSISRKAGGIYDAMRFLARDLGRDTELAIEIFGLEDAFTQRDLAGWFGLPTKVHRIAGPKFIGFSTELHSSLDGAFLDLLHSHGLWMYPSKASLRWAKSNHKPHILSPHGMLDTWAVNNHRWKKRIVGWLYENEHLRQAACLHALCDSEYRAIRSYGLTNPVCVIPNGIDLPDRHTGTTPAWQDLLQDNARVLLYLGRIHPKKGLVNLLRAWNMTRQGTDAGGPWVLVIAGWDQGGHEDELKSLAISLGISNKVCFVGPQFDEGKYASYARADAFVLPSFSEGLPMVVLEAWAHGLPVLMTPHCNLAEGFSAKASLRIEPEVGSLSEGLITLFSMTDQQRIGMGGEGKKLVKDKFSWPHIANEMLSVYHWILDHGIKPDCVRTD